MIQSCARGSASNPRARNGSTSLRRRAPSALPACGVDVRSIGMMWRFRHDAHCSTR